MTSLEESASRRRRAAILHAVPTMPCNMANSPTTKNATSELASHQRNGAVTRASLSVSSTGLGFLPKSGILHQRAAA